MCLGLCVCCFATNNLNMLSVNLVAVQSSVLVDSSRTGSCECVHAGRVILNGSFTHAVLLKCTQSAGVSSALLPHTHAAHTL